MRWSYEYSPASAPYQPPGRPGPGRRHSGRRAHRAVHRRPCRRTARRAPPGERRHARAHPGSSRLRLRSAHATTVPARLTPAKPRVPCLLALDALSHRPSTLPIEVRDRVRLLAPSYGSLRTQPYRPGPRRREALARCPSPPRSAANCQERAAARCGAHPTRHALVPASMDERRLAGRYNSSIRAPIRPLRDESVQGDPPPTCSHPRTSESVSLARRYVDHTHEPT